MDWSQVLGIVAALLGLNELFSDHPADIKIFLGIIPLFAGIMLVLGYQ